MSIYKQMMYIYVTTTFYYCELMEVPSLEWIVLLRFYFSLIDEFSSGLICNQINYENLNINTSAHSGVKYNK